jgi:hypothetical protein
MSDGISFLLINPFFTALATFVILWKMDILKATGYHVFIDITFFIFVHIFMYGTFNGVMTATMATVFLTFLLGITRWLHGYKKLTRKGWVYYAREGQLGEQT